MNPNCVYFHLRKSLLMRPQLFVMKDRYNPILFYVSANAAVSTHISRKCKTLTGIPWPKRYVRFSLVLVLHSSSPLVFFSQMRIDPSPHTQVKSAATFFAKINLYQNGFQIQEKAIFLFYYFLLLNKNRKNVVRTLDSI